MANIVYRVVSNAGNFYITLRQCVYVSENDKLPMTYPHIMSCPLY